MDETAHQGKRLPCAQEPYQLDCPFLGLRPTHNHPLRLPLLILNGVSVATGQCIVTTPLASKYTAGGDCPDRGGKPADCTLFAETWFFH